MISMSIADMSNGVNGTGVFDEGASPGMVAGGQQPALGRYPATAAQESGSRKGRRKCSIEENRVLMECYFKSIPEKRGYRQRMLRLWDEKGMVKVTEQRLADQARTILKSKWFTAVELEEIKRNKHGDCDDQNRTVVVEEANDGNEHELPAENVKEMDPQTAQEAQVQSEGCDEAPRQLSEDRLVIWKRLNEIRLSQDQDKVPSLKKIAKQRIREDLQVVEEVAAQIQTKDISETNRLLHATAVVVNERLDLKPGKKKATKEPWWKRRLQGQVDQLRKDLSRLEHVCRNECSRPRIRNQLWRNYKIETKGVAVVIEELKQRISAKAHKIKRYNDRILQYQQNRLFEVNQRQFYKELDDSQGSDQPTPDANEAREFWSNIWDRPVEHRRDAGWLNDLKGKTQVEQQDDLTIDIDKLRAILRKIPNWTAPGPNNVQGFKD